MAACESTPDVRKLADEIRARLDACESGEGMECANLDASLTRFGDACSDFCNGIRAWAQCVFAGKVEFDREVERLWVDEGKKLLVRAAAVWQQSETAEVPCFDLPGRKVLGAALWQLQFVMTNWVSPKRAVSPSPRVQLQGDLDQMGAQLAQLEPLPADWQPQDRSQSTRYRQAKSS